MYILLLTAYISKIRRKYNKNVVRQDKQKGNQFKQIDNNRPKWTDCWMMNKIGQKIFKN
jgi:hypothetical protein